jgi:hypothetical protein
VFFRFVANDGEDQTHIFTLELLSNMPRKCVTQFIKMGMDIKAVPKTHSRSTNIFPFDLKIQLIIF